MLGVGDAGQTGVSTLMPTAGTSLAPEGKDSDGGSGEEGKEGATAGQGQEAAAAGGGEEDAAAAPMLQLGRRVTKYNVDRVKYVLACLLAYLFVCLSIYLSIDEFKN